MTSESLRITEAIVIAAKVYYALFLNRMKPEIEKFLMKMKTVFGEINPQLRSFCLSVESSEEYAQKNLEAALLFVDFSKVID